MVNKSGDDGTQVVEFRGIVGANAARVRGMLGDLRGKMAKSCQGGLNGADRIAK
jgi:hypothetical protein